MINLNNYRANIYSRAGLFPCPGFGEDGVITKIFSKIGTSETPFCVEFGELRSLGSTTRSYRIKYFSDATYFSKTLNLKSRILNVIDVFKIVWTGKNLKYFKFFLSMPKKKEVIPGRVVETLDFDIDKEVDLFVIDIDSFDYEIIQEVLKSGFRPKIFVVEYNPNFPRDEIVWVTYEQVLNGISNGRIYGASYAALKELFDSYNYRLVHISGFCNLIFVCQEVQTEFQIPEIEHEITNTDELVMNFVSRHCTPGFVPSWLKYPPLKVSDFDQYKH